jgi:circadian clock protein KaiB
MKHVELLRFRLYITGNAPNSVLAVANLGTSCDRDLAGRHQIEVVDLLNQPEWAASDGICMTPTLVRIAPVPEVRIVGSLSDSAPLLACLGLTSP